MDINIAPATHAPAIIMKVIKDLMRTALRNLLIYLNKRLFLRCLRAGRTAVPGDAPTTSGIAAGLGAVWVNGVYGKRRPTVAG